MAVRRSTSVLAVGAQQAHGAEVKAVGDGKAHQQHAEQQPPDEAQHVI
jgi:hypothetical protein